MDDKFANKIRDSRKKQNLSQEELAKALGVSRQSVIALEQGKSLPSLPLVITICEFFKSPFEDIFDIHFEMDEEIDRMLDNENNQKININITESEVLANHPSPRLRMASKEDIMSNEMESWKPLREVVSLRDAMDRLFEDSIITPRGGVAMPKIDIKDKKDTIEVRAELPGIKEEDIEVEISDGVMTISGEKKEEKEEKDEGYYYRESHSGSFTRSFNLPSDVKEDGAEAEMKNGILFINLPKIEPKKATKVTIKK